MYVLLVELEIPGRLMPELTKYSQFHVKRLLFITFTENTEGMKIII